MSDNGYHRLVADQLRAERDEARAVARRLKRERDEARRWARAFWQLARENADLAEKIAIKLYGRKEMGDEHE